MATPTPTPAASNTPDRPQKKRAFLSFKSWWQRLTHHNSSNPDSHAVGPNTPLHRTSYQPQHAGRDALLAVPLAERNRGARPSRPASVAGLAVHPNSALSLEASASFSGPWGRGKGRERNSWSPRSSDQSQSRSGGGMESIREDRSEGEGQAKGSRRQKGQVPVRAPAHDEKRSSAIGADGTACGAAGSAVEGDGSSSRGSTVTSSTVSRDKNPGTSHGHDTRRLIEQQPHQRQREVDALVARRLQERVSPSTFGRRPAAGFGKRPLGAGSSPALGGRAERRVNGGTHMRNSMVATTTDEVVDVRSSGVAGREHAATAVEDGSALAGDCEQGHTSREMEGVIHDREQPPMEEDDITGGASDEAARTASSKAPAVDTEALPHTPDEPARNESVGTVASPTDTVFSSDARRTASSASEATTGGDCMKAEAFDGLEQEAVPDTRSGQERAVNERGGAEGAEGNEEEGCWEEGGGAEGSGAEDWSRGVLEAVHAL